VLENVKDGAREIADMVDRFNEISMIMGDPPEDADFDALDGGNGRRCRKRSTPSMAGRSTTSSKSRWRRCAARRATGRSTSSPAAKSAVSRCQLLIEKPDLLLLDEPTNHLDAETSNGWKSTCGISGRGLMITHDRYFLDNVTGWILELDRGKYSPTRATTPPIWKPRPSAWSRKAARRIGRQKAIWRAASGSVLAQGAPDQVEGPHQGL
jgi:ATPase subunit of ABC transporter with duplicated ATPase domains